MGTATKVLFRAMAELVMLRADRTVPPVVVTSGQINHGNSMLARVSRTNRGSGMVRTQAIKTDEEMSSEAAGDMDGTTMMVARVGDMFPGP